MSHVSPDFELVIRPMRGWLPFDLVEVWRYRDLLFLLIHRDVVTKYKQTVLGPAWFVLEPLLTTIVFKPRASNPSAHRVCLAARLKYTNIHANLASSDPQS